MRKTPDKDKDEKNFLQQFAADYEFGFHDTSKTSHTVLWLAFLFIIVAIVWAYLAIIDEVTVAEGKVVPSKQMQLIQNLEGGIVKEILVQKGQVVEKDQVIAYLDNTRFSSEYNSALKKQDALRVKIIRLNAEVEKKPLVIPKALRESVPELAQTETNQYQTHLNHLQSLKEQLDSVRKEISMTSPLVKSGAVSRVEVLHLEQKEDEIQTQILAFNSTALEDLNKAKTDLATIDQEVLAFKDRLTRTTVRSPVKGIVNQINVNTVGGVIKPGESLIEIVPLDDTLLVQAKVRPSDIGFIHVGQTATVKITAYDFTIYSGLTGKVEHISADTIKDEQERERERSYEIWVRTQKNYLGTKERPLYIIPGMTATVDILTGRKSVLSYLLKPILKAKESALRER